ncbi:geranylgeranylglycerol-phosphate geranylgeranyltransferase [Flavihumibacter rivuli]|uniref:geranylgeranylglycerol-phosphate geranylgeranyltransferase n=1 Tax=Flavihumibacter rivuli TaxID=2838156 RepID=UPI001BDE9301|nr:geranylgeranylglycerol-phosphate geranylgeranyltransferase [Flavihumibacter rivuli]ULQ57568.1 geranylgeranylglycerol-phosphate geranylgeranyltransferase [Flavihumibacter rivuli]
MKVIAAFFRLIRWPNIFFIILTQVLFYYCILVPSFLGPVAEGLDTINPKLSPELFGWLVLSSVCIAAAGYIINDYFDLNIDQVNKPDAIVVQRYIRRRWAIVWHLVLSLTGVVLAFYISWRLGNPVIGLANFACVLLLWFYSTTLKKQLLIGNVVISLLTAWVILVIYFAEFSVFRLTLPGYTSIINSLFKFTMIYSGFAFIISLIREVVKDLEDREGDARYGCRTMPIVWGLPVTKMFVFVWMIVLTTALVIVQFYGILKGWWLGALYSILAVVLPMGAAFIQLKNAHTPTSFHRLSTTIKWVMLAGILSMVFFKIYL